MDYSSADSEILESLEFLRPPVKRISGKTWNDKNINKNPCIEIYKAACKKCYKYTPEDISLIPPNPANTFTSQNNQSPGNQIFGKNSKLSYTTLLHPTYRKDHYHKCLKEDKPLINVTVIPKTRQTQTKRLQGKPVLYNTRIQRTTSSHERSIETKKIYLIVTGNRDKVYEIKPSESAQLSCGLIESTLVDGNHAIEGISNIKELIRSLDMDRKKNKKNKIATKRTTETDAVYDNSRVFKECACNEFTTFDINRNTDAEASRLRISGRVGLTEDDKYILNCTATVHNKPNIAVTKPIGSSPSKGFLPSNHMLRYEQNCNTYGCVTGSNKIDIMRNQKDSNIQVDFENINFDCGYKTQNNFTSKKAQGTQVDFDIDISKKGGLRTRETKDTIQCIYNDLDNIQSKMDKEVKDNEFEAYHNPLVIISVYPKQDTFESKELQKKPVWESSQQAYRSGMGASSRNSTRQGIGRYNQGSPRPSRTPSPIKKCFELNDKNNKHVNTRVAQSPRRKGSPPSHFISVTNRGQIKQQSNITGNKINTYTTLNKKNMQCVSKFAESKNVQAQLKKTLVDDYTKNLTRNMNRNSDINSGKHDNSRVNIKIEGDRGNYDVLLHPEKLETDLRIRKNVKENEAKGYKEPDNKAGKDLSFASGTMPTRRNVSPVKQLRQSKGVADKQNHTSTLNARDSIEIFRRRETSHLKKNSETPKFTNECYYKKNNKEYFAPIKHYTGDDCELPNPVERDKEIRGLLGIVKGISSISKQEHKMGSVSEDNNIVQCFYRKTCNKSLDTGISLNKLYSDCFMNEYNKEKKESGCNEKEHPLRNVRNVPSIEDTSLYNQLTLNRNIQVFLQVEQFSKQKPIILSRKQYDKVKKTIQKTISRRAPQYKCKNSIISVGEVRKRAKADGPAARDYAKYTQTKSSATICNNNFADRNKDLICTHENCVKQRQVQTIVLFDLKKSEEHINLDTVNKAISQAKQAISSVRVRYTNDAYFNNNEFSSTNVESLSSTNFNQRNNSLFTLFKGHRKTPTPNLGTSVFSLLSSSTKSRSKYIETSSSTPDIKAKKPFLKRLMSCLVMQSRLYEKKLQTNRVPKASSIDSSKDSYYINTSLGVMEMTSSIYDTSASFYSNHAISPINTNTRKRGFLSSVKGFLTTRRSFILNHN